VHWPAGRARQEQRAPSTEFSVPAFSQSQCSAGCLPQEQVACWAAVGGLAGGFSKRWAGQGKRREARVVDAWYERKRVNSE
jgi:hypothetical protein